MTLTLLIGTLAALLLTGVVVAYQRAPTRVRCPECGATTKAVMAPSWLHRAAPNLHVRWCPRCSWEGLGRAGPEWISGRKIAHDSGFHWGEERLPVDFGFRWRPLPEERYTDEMPDHPSGFRFGGPPDPAQGRAKAHPSGFGWRQDEATGDGAPDAPPTLGASSGARRSGPAASSGRTTFPGSALPDPSSGRTRAEGG